MNLNVLKTFLVLEKVKKYIMINNKLKPIFNLVLIFNKYQYLI